MTISLKPGVSLADLTPQIVLAIVIIAGVCHDFGIPCVITSVNDGVHSANSWHYKGRAVDIRTKYPVLNGREQEFAGMVKDRLGAQFDVVMEAVGEDNEHLHVEYDPKVTV